MNEPAKNGIGKEPVPVSSADVPPNIKAVIKTVCLTSNPITYASALSTATRLLCPQLDKQQDRF